MAPDGFIVHVPVAIGERRSRDDTALLLEFLTDLIRQRSPQIGHIRSLRIFSPEYWRVEQTVTR